MNYKLYLVAGEDDLIKTIPECTSSFYGPLCEIWETYRYSCQYKGALLSIWKHMIKSSERELECNWKK